MKNKTIRDVFYSILYQMTGVLLPLISAPLVSRALGAEGLGIQSVVEANTSYFTMLALLGLQNYGNRTVAMQTEKKAADRVFWEIYSMQLISGTISILLYGLVFLASGIGHYQRYYAINSIYVLASILDISWYFYGKAEFRFISLRSIAVRVLSFLATIVFVQQESHVWVYLLIIALSHLLSALTLWGKLLRTTPYEKPNWDAVKKHIKPNLILFIPIVSIQVYRVMDKTMLGPISGNVQSGLYAAADRIVSVALTLFTAIGTVMLPHSTKMVATGNTQQLRRSIRNTMQIQMLIAVCLCGGMLCISTEALTVYYGQGFSQAGKILQILSVIPIINVWKSVLRNQFLIPKGYDRAYIWALISGALVNLIVNTILIPVCGAKGAAVGTVTAEVTGMMVMTVAARELPIKTMLRDMLPFLASGACMMVLLVPMKQRITGFGTLLAVICLAAFCYLVIVAAIMWIGCRERLKELAALLMHRKTQKNGDK